MKNLTIFILLVVLSLSSSVWAEIEVVVSGGTPYLIETNKYEGKIFGLIFLDTIQARRVNFFDLKNIRELPILTIGPFLFFVWTFLVVKNKKFHLQEGVKTFILFGSVFILLFKTPIYMLLTPLGVTLFGHTLYAYALWVQVPKKKGAMATFRKVIGCCLMTSALFLLSLTASQELHNTEHNYGMYLCTASFGGWIIASAIKAIKAVFRKK